MSILKLKGNRGLVNRKSLSSSLDKPLYEKLKTLSDITKVPLSKLLDEAVELLLEKRGG